MTEATIALIEYLHTVGLDKDVDLLREIVGMVSQALMELEVARKASSISNEGHAYLQQAPWISIFSGMAIMVAVLAFNLAGDGLRDALDPSMSQ